jgi:hypothetical protein
MPPQIRGLAGAQACRNFTQPGLLAALHQENWATIDNYLEMELRYMDAGERRPKSAKAGPEGTPGYQ